MQYTLLENLQKYFGHSDYLPGQKEIIENLFINKKHSLVLMPTGGGKSICYQLPAISFSGQSIVISPLIALMQDQVDKLRKKNIPASFINSSIGKKDRESRLESFVKGNTKILYVTPERFRKSAFVEAISNVKIDLLAIDEAHCVSDWGHDFRPDYSRISEFRKVIGNPLTIALTATATPEVQKDIIEKLGLNDSEVELYNHGIKRENLKLDAIDVYGEQEKLEEILKILEEYHGTGIIYFSLIKTLDRFSELLYKNKIPHLIYHGKLNNKDRRDIQREFIGGDDVLVLATNAFGMGIDKPDIRFIIHAELPGSIESYYQEIGRAGRDGKESICTLLFDQQDINLQMEFIKWSNPEAKFYARLYALLEDNIDEVNAGGTDYLREQLVFKNRGDFRLETALGILDRFNAIEGSLQKRDLRLTGEIPDLLFDEDWISEKLMSDQKRLLAMVNYFNEKGDRKEYLNRYFGV